jgi:hypothetical protein
LPPHPPRSAASLSPAESARFSGVNLDPGRAAQTMNPRARCRAGSAAAILPR